MKGLVMILGMTLLWMSCQKIEPVSGFENPTKDATMRVRNPSDAGVQHNRYFQLIMENANQETEPLFIKSSSLVLGMNTVPVAEYDEQFRESSDAELLAAISDPDVKEIYAYMLSNWPEPFDPMKVMANLDYLNAKIALNTTSKRDSLFDITSVFEYSTAMHGGLDWDGTDYGAQTWNPVPNVEPESKPWLDPRKIITADVNGFMQYWTWQAAAFMSAVEIARQLIFGIGPSVVGPGDQPVADTLLTIPDRR